MTLPLESEKAIVAQCELLLSQANAFGALELSVRALEKWPDSRVLRHRHATALQRSGHPREACDLLEKLHVEQPSSIGIALEFAAVSRHLGEVARADEIYRKILETSPAQEGAQAGLIEIALARGEIDVALARSTEALAHTPDSRVLRHRHATTLRSAAQNQKAYLVLKRLYDEAPDAITTSLDFVHCL